MHRKERNGVPREEEKIRKVRSRITTLENKMERLVPWNKGREGRAKKSFAWLLTCYLKEDSRVAVWEGVRKDKQNQLGEKGAAKGCGVIFLATEPVER